MLVLSSVAGYVNAVATLVLVNIAISHITGDSQDLAVALARVHPFVMLEMAMPVVTFLLGIAAGAVVMELAVRHGLRRRLTLMLALEGGLIGAFVVCAEATGVARGRDPGSPLGLFAAISLAAGAMGIQTSAVDRLRGRPIRTTYLSGMITRLAHASVRWGFWIRDRMTAWPRDASLRGSVRESRRLQSYDRVLLLAGLWGTWVVGAAVGADVELRFGAVAAALPLVALALVAVADWSEPFEFPSPLPPEDEPGEPSRF